MSSSKEKSSVKQNRMLEVWKQFRRNRGAMIGLVVLIFLILIAVFADVIWDYDTDITAMQVGDRLLKPCLAHPFGTDNYGRDMEPDIPWLLVLPLYLWEVR
jgi:peptide/nickel transport system permease protein